MATWDRVPGRGKVALSAAGNGTRIKSTRFIATAGVFVLMLSACGGGGGGGGKKSQRSPVTTDCHSAGPYVVYLTRPEVDLLGTAPGVVTPIPTATNVPGAAISIAPSKIPGAIAATPDGSAVY